MAYTFLKWKAALEAHGIDRNTLPYKAWWQPFSAYYALVGTFVMAFVGGYTVFLPGNWSVPTFLFSYTMIGVFPILFVFWKVYKKTKWLKPHEVDLTRDLDEIAEYEANYVPRTPRYVDKVTTAVKKC